MGKIEKDYTNKKTRIKCGILTSIFGLIINLVLFEIKFVAGFIANSMTVIADAFNSLADFGSCVVTILGFRMASKPTDKKPPYANSKYEYVFGIIVAILILINGVILSKISFERMYAPEVMMLSEITFLVLLISIILKGVQFLVYWRIANKMDSHIFKESAKVARNDLYMTIGALLSLAFMSLIKYNLDAISGLVLSMLVIYHAPRATRESVDPLLGTPENLELIEKIKEIFLAHTEIVEIREFLVHTYGFDSNFATVNADIDALKTMLEGYELSRVITKEVEEKLGVKLEITIEPKDLEKSKVKDIYKRTKIALNEVDKDLKFRRFEAFSEHHRIYICFLVLVPFRKTYEPKELESLMRKAYKKDEDDKCEYDFDIQVDRPVLWPLRRISKKIYSLDNNI